MTFFRDLGVLLRFGGFRKLFAVRLVSQLTDGIFQSGLAATVLFSPEKAPTAGAIAAAFATILLPFTLLGPFVGVFLDRWSRRRILIVSNAARAVLVLVVALLVAHASLGPVFYVLVLTAFSLNRFLLAGLSAGQPSVVPRRLLVTANAVSPTCGSLAYLVGLGVGGGIHGLAHSDVLVLVVGAAAYVLASLAATRLPFLGPALDGATAEVRDALDNVYRGLLDAARHLPPLARLALTIVGAVRLPYGVMIVATVLLYRNEFVGPGGGLAGLGVAVAASGVGFGIAALLTPSSVERWGTARYLVALALLAAVVQVFPAMLYTPWAIAGSAVGLGVATQGAKICVDTTLQRVVGDVYLGRIFSLYDFLFNGVLVLATVIAALALPATGRSYAVLGVASAWYLGLALVVARRWAPDSSRSPVGPDSVPGP
ncbi:MAG: MFS transporter [Lapillicoccus sp.]